MIVNYISDNVTRCLQIFMISRSSVKKESSTLETHLDEKNIQQHMKEDEKYVFIRYRYTLNYNSHVSGENNTHLAVHSLPMNQTVTSKVVIHQYTFVPTHVQVPKP